VKGHLWQQSTPSLQEYLIFRQRLEQEMGSLKGMSIKVSHVLPDIGNLAKIEKSEHVRSRPLANWASVLGQGAIATVMQTIFDEPVLTLQIQQTKGVACLGVRLVIP
jgi:hypothetical protein